MKICHLHHAQITIPPEKEDEARTFYCDILGLTEIPKPDSLRDRGGFWVQLGDVQIHIGVEKELDRTKTKAHLAYQVDDLIEWREHLQNTGIEVKDSIPIPEYNRFEFRDPFGNRVEFIQPVHEVEVE